MADERAGELLRRIAPSAFLPPLVYEIGNGAIAPIIALTALDLGASTSLAGFMLALLGLGQVIGNVPSSSLAVRIGDRPAMMVAAAIDAVALVVCLLANSLVILGAALLVVGMCNAMFYLARMSYLSEVVPPLFRARAMSTLGGAHRVGLFLGPFAGAAAIGVAGLRAAYVVAVGAAGITALLLLLIPDAEHAGATPSTRGAASSRTMLVRYGRLFRTLGIAVLAVGAVRAARQTVLPLWAEHVGLSPATTSVIFGVASAVDMALFYPAGKIMDQFGRLSIGVPAMLIMGTSMMLLPLAGGLAAVTVVAVAISFGNGLSSGVMMTLGADVAPADDRIKFLSIWRVLTDTGNAAGPVVIAAVASVATLGLGIIAVGTAGVIAAAALAAFVPRYSPLATRAMVRQHQ